MEVLNDKLLAGAYASAKGGPDKPREVLRRLKLVARLLHGIPGEGGQGPLVAWLDARGEVAWKRIGASPVVVGREATCDVVLSGPRVSRRHCSLQVIGGERTGVELTDLGSSNGTQVNGMPWSPGKKRLLAHGDVIEVGGVGLVISLPE